MVAQLVVDLADPLSQRLAALAADNELALVGVGDAAHPLASSCTKVFPAEDSAAASALAEAARTVGDAAVQPSARGTRLSELGAEVGEGGFSILGSSGRILREWTEVCEALRAEAEFTGTATGALRDTSTEPELYWRRAAPTDAAWTSFALDIARDRGGELYPYPATSTSLAYGEDYGLYELGGTRRSLDERPSPLEEEVADAVEGLQEALEARAFVGVMRAHLLRTPGGNLVLTHIGLGVDALSTAQSRVTLNDPLEVALRIACKQRLRRGPTKREPYGHAVVARLRLPAEPQELPQRVFGGRIHVECCVQCETDRAPSWWLQITSFAPLRHRAWQNLQRVLREQRIPLVTEVESAAAALSSLMQQRQMQSEAYHLACKPSQDGTVSIGSEA